MKEAPEYVFQDENEHIGSEATMQRGVEALQVNQIRDFNCALLHTLFHHFLFLPDGSASKLNFTAGGGGIHRKTAYFSSLSFQLNHV